MLINEPIYGLLNVQPLVLFRFGPVIGHFIVQRTVLLWSVLGFLVHF